MEAAPQVETAPSWFAVAEAVADDLKVALHQLVLALNPRVGDPYGSASGNPVAAARAWARRLLPELVDRPTRDSLGDDLDLVLSELVGNALRHAGGVREVGLSPGDGVVRVIVVDADDRAPVVREPGEDLESGRGLLLVNALSQAWGVQHDVARGGKGVWSELLL